MTALDVALVTRAQAGDRAAFEELVRRTSRLVFAKIYLETGNRDRAEDIVQETYLTAYRSIRQVTEPKGFRTWLLSIAHSTVIDAFRRETRKKRAGRPTDPELLSNVPGADPEPGRAAEAAEDREQALKILRSLPEEYRMPLTLRYFAGADYETISRQLGLTNGSLRGLLHRGMALLRERLGKTAQGARHG